MGLQGGETRANGATTIDEQQQAPAPSIDQAVLIEKAKGWIKELKEEQDKLFEVSVSDHSYAVKVSSLKANFLLNLHFLIFNSTGQELHRPRLTLHDWCH